MTQVTAAMLANAALDCDTIADVATSSNPTTTDRLGNVKQTLVGAIQALGYQPPVAYTNGLSMTLITQTVEYSGGIYAVNPSYLPFTTSGTFETAKFRLLSTTSSALSDGSVTLTKLADGVLEATVAGRAKMADGFVNADKLAGTLDLSGKTLTLPAANTPIFTASYASTNQTISDNGVLMLTHGLGAAPLLMRFSIVCVANDTTTEYVTGDVLEVVPENEAGKQYGFTVRPTSTTLIVTFFGPYVFKVKKKTSSGSANIDLTKWKLVVRAWA